CCLEGFFVQAAGGIRYATVTGVQTFALPISLGFALFGGSLGCLRPAEKGPLGGPHVADDLLTQTGACAGKRLDGLINNPHIVRVADVSLQCGGVDPNPARLDRPSLQQLLDQMLVRPLIRSSPNL